MLGRLVHYAEEIMRAGLERRESVSIPYELHGIAQECYDVPERPASYSPVYSWNCESPDTIALVTGGLDSSAMYFMALANGEKPRPMYFNLGQAYAQKEVAALARMGIKVSIANHALMGVNPHQYWKHIIPARNLLLFARAAQYLPDGGVILFGVTAGETPNHGGDKSIRFLRQAHSLLASQVPSVALNCPIAGYTKTALVRWWLQHQDVDLLRHTVTCFSAEEGHCGACQACLRKWIAYANNGLELKTKVPVKVGCREYVEKYRRLMHNALEEEDFSRYSRARCLETLGAIKSL